MLESRQQAAVAQFQIAAGDIIDEIKKADVAVLYNLLKDWFSIPRDEDDELVITDLGCGEGKMLLQLLRMMSENIKNYAELKIRIYATEPNDDLREKFKSNLTATPDKPYLANVQLMDPQKEGIQDYPFNHLSDLVLLSHSLYYDEVQRCWNSKCVPDLFSQNNLFTWLLEHLKPRGKAAVLLQSDEPSKITHHSGGFFGTNAELERKVTRTSEADQANMTNGKEFGQSVDDYNQQADQKIEMVSDQSMAKIDLGRVLFDGECFAAQQPDERTKSRLLFYARKEYDSKEFAHFFKSYCINEKGDACVYHPNDIFVLGHYLDKVFCRL